MGVFLEGLTGVDGLIPYPYFDPTTVAASGPGGYIYVPNDVSTHFSRTIVFRGEE